MIACGFFQGAMAIALGLYIDHHLKHGDKPSRESFMPARVHGRKADRRQPSRHRRPSDGPHGYIQ